MARLFCVLAALALLTGLFAPLAAPPANACSCVEPNAQASLELSKTIFTGRLDDLRPSSTEMVASFTVDQYLLGSGPETQSVGDGPGCNAFSEDGIGKRHLVLMYQETPWRDEEYGGTSICIGSGSLEGGYGAAIFLEQLEDILGPGSPPVESSVVASDDDFPYLPAAAVALLIPALLAAAAFLPRRS